VESIGKLLEAALNHYEKKEYGKAERALNELLSTHPDFHRGWFLKGIILEETERPEEAKECLLKAGNIFNMFLRLAVQIEGSDPQRALIYYDRALEMDPKSNPALLNKGLILESMGRIDDARSCYKDLSPLREIFSRIIVPLGFMSFLVAGGAAMLQRGEKGLSLIVMASAVFCFFWLKRDAGTAIKMLIKKWRTS
jgi:tetratricopeptide (TPR) repeat protein